MPKLKTTRVAEDAMIQLVQKDVTYEPWRLPLLVATALLSACLLRAGAGDPDLKRGMQVVVADIAQQLSPAVAASRILAIDPLLDGRTGQQTRASLRVQQELANALSASMSSMKVLTLDSEGAAQSRLIITGTVTLLPEPDRYRVSVSLSDRQSSLVVAQSGTVFRERDLDISPTKFYVDSPSLVRDRSVEGYMRTAETPAGRPADALYIEQVPTAALLAEALSAYNEERWEDALTRYSQAVQRTDGQQLRTLNGIYLCNVQLGRMPAAEAAFGKIAALGLATNNLAVKLLFRPGTTDFWADSRVSGVYPMWLRQIAREAQVSGNCLHIVGHTSRTGSEPINDKLSLARATSIRDKLAHEAAGLANRVRVSGEGSRQNLVGSGKDDASDALDRRVEFRVVDCARPAS